MDASMDGDAVESTVETGVEGDVTETSGEGAVEGFMETSQEAGGVMVEALTAVDLVEAIQAAGCAVTPVTRDGGVQLSSACHGVGFSVLWGNAMAPGRFADITLSCPLRVQGGTLAEEVFAEWHRAKRFARMSRHGDYVALEMDVIAAGGITRGHLHLMLQLWTQMMGQFLAHLRNVRPEGAPA